ncbi:MAG: hypothetical protein ACOY0T_12170 [Myxococcota bacterium]
MRRVTQVVSAFLALAITGCSSGKREPGRFVECTLNYATTTQVVKVRATREPYAVRPTLVAERFAFKAVFTEGAGGTASINLYVYSRTPEGDRLLQEVKYVAPFPGSAANAKFGFTGHQFVYSNDAREFDYWCALRSP